jgi:hypothetical protein
VAAWEAGPLGRLTAAAGVAGGAWSPAAGLSSPARGAVAPSLTLDATGAPWLLWTETANGFSPLPARGARLVAGAPALDRTPPGLVTSLPGRARLVRGLVRIRVPVTCAEACDARLSLVWHGVELGATVRALPAGRRGLLTTRLYVPKRTLRVQVLVADRAGNSTSRSRVLRVSR